MILRVQGLVSHLSSVVDNPVLTSKVAVTVHVLDINEFPPELTMPYETFVCESAKAGQVSLCKCVYACACLHAENQFCSNDPFKMMYDRLQTLTLSLNP